jgi:hypothetical protein
MARYLAALDEAGKLEEFFTGGAALDAPARRRVEREEGWILGALAT